MLASSSGLPAQRLSSAGLATVVALHVLVLLNVVRLPEPLAVLTVDFIKPPEIVKPPTPPTSPKPRPVEKRPEPRPVQQPVQLAAPVASPAPLAIAVPPAPTAFLYTGHRQAATPGQPTGSEPAALAPMQHVQVGGRAP